MRKTLQTIVTAAWFGLAGLLMPREAPAQQTERYELKESDFLLMHSGTLPGSIGNDAKTQILETAMEEVEKSPFARVRKEFKERHEVLATGLKPGYGKVILSQPDGKKRQECAVYLFFDDNNDGIFNIGTQVRPEAQEHGLFSIPNNTFFGMHNSPFISGCDEYVTKYEKLFEYRLFERIGDENQSILQRVNRIDKKKYANEEWERIKRCVVKTAALGIENNSESLELIREGSKIMDDEFAQWFSSLQNPQPHPNAELAVFKLASLPTVFTTLYIDKNRNGEPDSVEDALLVIEANQRITMYDNQCGFEPKPRVEAPKPTEHAPPTVAPNNAQRLTEEREKRPPVHQTKKDEPFGVITPATYFTRERLQEGYIFGKVSKIPAGPFYVGLDLGMVLTRVENLHNVTFHNKEYGIEVPADFEGTKASGMLTNGTMGLTLGVQATNWLLVNVRGGVGNYDFTTESTARDKTEIAYLALKGGLGLVVSLFDDAVRLTLEGEYVAGKANKNQYTTIGEWELPKKEGESSSTLSGTIQTELNLPRQRHANARAELSWMTPLGIYAQVFTQSEGVNVPLCELISCEGMYGRVMVGGGVGYLIPLGRNVDMSASIIGKNESGGMDSFYEYTKRWSLGVALSLHIHDRKDTPYSAIALPEFR
ncbi:MAG: hypothetical protein Q7R76_00795 [Candidatus Woesearchaeota archaeon]|nr:hypothetical protein [Candidatus Woesearchaeota archaeon]